MSKKTSKKKPNSPRKGVKKEDKASNLTFSLQGKCIFLTYKGVTDSGQKITKENLANFLLNQNQNDVKLRPTKYLVCEQRYEDGQPHFHVILIYQRRKQIHSQNFYDYKGIHPNIQTMRNMNAALDYVCKQDSDPLTNMDIVAQKRLARASHSSTLYDLLYDQMVKDPFNFDPLGYCVRHNIHREVYKTNYTKAVKFLRLIQQAYCNQLLSQKPGIRIIDRSLIQATLTPPELEIYDSWSGYQTIVSYLNQIPAYGYKRPIKTKNLLITGPSNIGKTSLMESDLNDTYNCVERYCSIYPMSAKTWWPNYKSETYQVISWNQAKLTAFSYDVILKVLEGSKVDLPQKGTSTLKYDNPLVVLTSNMTLEEMIKQKFGYNKSYMQMARRNLAVRVQNVVIPDGYTLFILQKLLMPPDSL